MTTTITKGSIADLSNQTGKPIAETFVSADTIILVDVSGSMDFRDLAVPSWNEGIKRQGLSRYEQACQELATLQATLPGKIAVVGFASDAQFHPSGVPTFQMSGTDLAGALEFVHIADDCGIRFIVISDGAPDDEPAALKMASRFKSQIDTIFIGNPGEPGQRFLERLAQASGGQGLRQGQAAGMAQTVQKLLTAA